MSSTFLRGLALIETVGLEGPLTVGELARRLDTDKATVSRMVTAASAHGWLARTPAGVVLGARLPMLAHNTDLSAALLRVQALTEAVAGVTGLFAQAYLLIGHGVVPVVSAGRPPISLPRPLTPELPVWSIAGGRAAASLLTRGALVERLGLAGALDQPLPGASIVADLGAAVGTGLGQPLPAAQWAAPMTGAAFLDVVDEVRAAGVAYDHGQVHPLVHCIAVPWSGLGEPAGLCVLGTPAEIASGSAVAHAVLRAAVGADATREQIVRCAAEVAGRP